MFSDELEAVMNAAPAAIFVAHDPDARVISANPAGYALFRMSPGDNLALLGQDGRWPAHLRVLIDGVETPPGEMPLQRALRTGQPVRNCEVRIAFDDAPYIDLFGNAQPMFDANGRTRGAVSVFNDITQRKGAEAALRENADILSIVLEATSEGVWDWNIQTGDAVFSPRYSTMLGYDPEEFAENYKRWRGMVHPDDVERVKQHHADHFAGRTPFSIEFRMREKSGNWHWIHSRGLLIERDAEGKPLRMVGTHSSIQERKRAEEERERLQAELAHAQKMECVGRLAGGIAHDFNNLMSVILLHGDSAVAESNAGESAVSSVHAIVQAAEKAAGLARQLMAFSQKQMLQTEVLDLSSVVSESEKLVQRLIGEDIELRFVPGPDPCLVTADRSQLDQILFNLAVNSRDAMPDGGTLTIETAPAELDGTDLQSSPDARPGRYVVLSVADTGIGMSAETQARIFEPFFTTKGVGKGTGLGLSVVYGIVKQSDGFIIVRSEPGKGTEFRIHFPAVQEMPQPRPEPAAAPLMHGTETILLAEDEPALRAKISDILTGAGYTVLSAGDGQDALKIAVQRRQPIDLLLTDVVMPGLSGGELARRVAAVRPETKILYMSGYPNAGEPISILQSAGNFIAKPFSQERLLRSVRGALERVVR